MNPNTRATRRHLHTQHRHPPYPLHTAAPAPALFHRRESDRQVVSPSRLRHFTSPSHQRHQVVITGVL